MTTQNLRDTQNNFIRTVAPTVIIGLGGTGKEVLLRLRRRFFERFNNFGFPTVGYLWIDTDVRNIDIDNKPLDHIMEQVSLGEEEMVNAEIPPNAFANYFKDVHSSKHIFSWLDTSLEGMGQVINGAGQIRPLGRLAFFHHFEDIRSKLIKTTSRVVSMTAVEDLRNQYGLTADTTSLNVMVVCSIAGGTGSGMFLDLSFLCRQALTDSNRKVDITGYLLLPSVFSDGSSKEGKKIYANGYAALKELEFYSAKKDVYYRTTTGTTESREAANYSKHDFAVDWQNNERISSIKPPPIEPPPFNTCYLIDNESQKGVKIGPSDKSHLCDMITENIFMNFSNESFSRLKDSIRSNLEQYLANPLYYRYDDFGKTGGYTEIFNQRFSAFGFSKLTVPIDRIRRACGYKLSLDLIDCWLKTNQLSDINIEQRLEPKELKNMKLQGKLGAENNFIEELNRVGEENFDSFIAKEIGRRKDDWKNLVKDQRPNLKRVIENFRDAFIKNFDKTDSQRANWGQFVKTLEQNNERFIQMVVGEFSPSQIRMSDGGILSRVKVWLADPNVRLPLTIKYLKVLNVILERFRENFQQELNRAKARAKSANNDIQAKLSILDQEESGKIVWRKSLNILVDMIGEQLRVAFQSKMRQFILEKAINAIENVFKPYIGKEKIQKDESGQDSPVRDGLVLELWNLQNDLNGVREKLKKRLSAFEKVETHKIFEVLYQEGMFYDYYKIQDSQGIFPVHTKLEELEALILQDLSCANPYDLKNYLEKMSAETIIDKIDSFCYARFQNLEVEADAMEIFHKMYEDRGQRTERLNRLVNNASVWLPQSSQSQTLLQVSNNRQTKALASFVQKNHDKYRETYDEIVSLVQAAGYSSPERASTNRTDGFYIYTECAGIPLAYLHNIENYRNEYLLALSSQKPLHIDVRDEKFTDIYIKNTSESEKILRAKKCLLLGAILNVIKISFSNRNEPGFAFVIKRDGIPKNQPLGNEILAVETLKRNDELLQNIEAEINRVKEIIYIDQQNKCRLYALLNYYINDSNQNGRNIGPYAKFYYTTSQGMVENYSPEYKVLSEELSQVYRALSDGDEQIGETILNQYFPNESALDQFTETVLIDNRQWRIFKPNLLA